MMQYEENWERPADVTTNPDFILDYYKRYNTYDGDYKAQVVSATVIFAASEERVFEEKDGSKRRVEMLNLCFRIEGKSKQYRFEATLWGSRINSDGSKGKMPAKLHDFLNLCKRQRADFLGGSFEREHFKDIQIVYPNICGCKFKLVIATVGKTPKGFLKYDFGIFNENGFSVIELEQKSPSAAHIEIMRTNLKQAYADYVKAEGFGTPDVYTSKYNQTAAPASVPPVAPNPDLTSVNLVNSLNAIKGSTVDQEDDIPF